MTTTVTTTVSTVPAQRPASRPARRTQAERRAESERRLIQAAAELIVERGIEGTSLAEIGRRAGYSHGLVHQRFGSKDALIERLAEQAVQLFTVSTVAAIGDAQGAQAVRMVAENYLDLIQGADPIARVHLLVWCEAIAAGSGKRPYRVGWDRLLRSSLAAMITTGIADGSIRSSLDPEPAAVIIVGLLRGVALQLMIDPDAGTTAGARSAVLHHLDGMLGG
jgi:AcrR family transcriptional regulator